MSTKLNCNCLASHYTLCRVTERWLETKLRIYTATLQWFPHFLLLALLDLQTKYETEIKEAKNQQLLQANQQQEHSTRYWEAEVLYDTPSGIVILFYRDKQKANRKLEVQKQQIESNLREKESRLREISPRKK